MSDRNNLPEHEKSSLSLPAIVAAAVFAVTAIAVVGFLLTSRSGDSEPQLDAPDALDLAAPLYRDGSTEFRLHLIVDDVQKGENLFTVSFTQGGDALEPFDADLEGVDLTLAPLVDADGGKLLSLQPNAHSEFETETPVDLTDGWWEATVTLYRADDDPQSTVFYLLVPDPNLHDLEIVSTDENNSAQAFFEAGLRQIESTHSIKYIERLTSGEGMVSISQREVTDGNGGVPAARMVNAQFELLTIGDRSFQRTPGRDWFEREFLPILPVSEWPMLYEGATDFALGESVMVNDRATQIIMFHVPVSETFAPATYAWWVDEETGYVIREAMISTWHYMIYEFGEFNQPLQFEIPIAASTPQASPAASPIGSPAPG
ncbi:MAG: hypothetical protein AB7V46_14660 [Thermomicrobiales bacterium]